MTKDEIALLKRIERRRQDIERVEDLLGSLTAEMESDLSALMAMAGLEGQPALPIGGEPAEGRGTGTGTVVERPTDLCVCGHVRDHHGDGGSGIGHCSSATCYCHGFRKDKAVATR